MKKEDEVRLEKLIQTYKSYLDQSQFLNMSIEVISKMSLPSKSESEKRELRLLLKYSILLVSLINLNNLAEGFNKNKNILNLPSDDYIFLSSTSEF